MFENREKNQLSIKIGDLGHSRKIEDYLKSFVGTPFYFSPELTRNQAYTAKTDVWSAGCTIYEMIKLERPYEQMYSFDEPVKPIDEFESISDAILFG